MSTNNKTFSSEANEEAAEMIEKVVHINRCAKVVKGGRRFSFSALVVVGDQKGGVGVGYGKAKEVPECIRKGTEDAKKNIIDIKLRGDTIHTKFLVNLTEVRYYYVQLQPVLE